MDTIDRNTARQVWSRVTAAPAPGLSPGDLYNLMSAAGETAALYRGLTSSLSGKQRESALILLAGQQETLWALGGMQRISFGKGTSQKAGTPSQKQPRRILEACFHQARNALTEYTARTIDTQYGPVFRLLAAREEEHCLRILTLLGQL